VAIEFNLFCDQKDERTIISSIPYLGMTIGPLLLNYVGDKYDRLLAIRIGFILSAIGSFFFTIAQDIITLSAALFIQNLGVNSLLVLIFVHIFETSGT
jgi:MFS family permease